MPAFGRPTYKYNVWIAFLQARGRGLEVLRPLLRGAEVAGPGGAPRRRAGPARRVPRGLGRAAFLPTSFFACQYLQIAASTV